MVQARALHGNVWNKIHRHLGLRTQSRWSD
ncbi:hypothetical protein [Paraburkholderia sp. J7]